jgi:glyoxylase-like metal-dependent hydrolase (beta-lactamase superfamily II)
MNMHLISTGRVKITQNWRVGKGEGAIRLINTLLDRNFTDWLPITCAVIQHPEGLIVIDTGIPADANKRLYFPPHMPLVQRAAPFLISEDEEIGSQMQARGLDPLDVRWVIQTHLHQDHDGGMHCFPNAEFLISRRGWAAGQGLSGRMGGYLNWRWKGITPRLVDFSSGSYHSFDASEVVTRAGDVRLVPTPGHSAGHLSVALEDGDKALFFAGDAAYSQDLLLRDTVDGVAVDPHSSRDSHRRIMKLAAQIPTVFLPSHDPENDYRLQNRMVIPVTNGSVNSSTKVFS